MHKIESIDKRVIEMEKIFTRLANDGSLTSWLKENNFQPSPIGSIKLSAPHSMQIFPTEVSFVILNYLKIIIIVVFR